MLKSFLLTAAVLLALFSCGLHFGWEIGVLDDGPWRRDAPGWLALSAAAFALSFHPLIARIDREYR